MCRCNPLLGARRPRPHLTTVLVQKPCQLRFSQPPPARSDEGVGATGCRVGLPIAGAWSITFLDEWKTHHFAGFDCIHQQLLIGFVLYKKNESPPGHRLGRRCVGATGCRVGATGCRVGLQTTLRLHPSAASYWFCAE